MNHPKILEKTLIQYIYVSLNKKILKAIKHFLVFVSDEVSEKFFQIAVFAQFQK